VLILFQLADNKLVITTEDELAARRDALKSIVERQIELNFRLSERDDDINDSLTSEHVKQIKKELAELSDMEARHRVYLDSAMTTMQKTLDELKQDLMEMSTVCSCVST